MIANTEIRLGDIQRTLLMPVWARAVDAKKSNSFLNDKKALEIIEYIDYDFSHMDQNIPEISQLSWIARCKRFDIIIQDFIKNNPSGTVINIGSGLDTTYERINNNSVMWYDLDLPDVIEVRKKLFSESPVREFISASFLDDDWFGKCEVKNKALLAAAGVFVYFEAEQIKEFLIKTAEHYPGAELFFDATSPKGVEIANQVISRSGLKLDSCFKWGLEDPRIIESWDHRFKILNTYHTFKIDGLQLSEENQKIAMISDSLNVMYMVHLKV